MHRSLLVLIAAALLAAPLLAQTYIPGRTAGVIVGDRFGDALWRLTDLDLDRGYEGPGEIQLFYSGANGPLLATIQDLAFGTDGTLYATDSSLDVVLALRDLDLNGDVDGVGENAVYFDNTNAAGIPFGSPMGLTVAAGVGTAANVVWIANSSNPLAPSDILIRCQDGNGDGDANDVGEARIFWDNATGIANGNPDLDIPAAVHIGAQGQVLLLHGAGLGAAKGIYLLRDLTADGDANDAGEVTPWFIIPAASTVVSFEMTGSRNGDVYVVDRGTADTIYAVRDLNFDDAITLPTEMTVYWTDSSGASLVDNMCEIVEYDGSISLLLAEDSTPDRVLRLADLSGDGTIANATEQFTAYDENTAGVVNIGQPKAIEALPGAFLQGPPIVFLGTTFTLTHRSVRGHTFNLAFSFPAPPLTFAPFGVFHLGFDAIATILGAPVPASGVFTASTFVPAVPALAGITFHVQTADQDGVFLQLSNLYVLSFQ